MSADSAAEPSDPVAARSVQLREQAQFRALRRSFVRFIAPLTALFLLWYLAYVVIAGLAPGLFAVRLGGSYITVGLLFGLGQFVTTFGITMLYRWWADRRYDPRAAALRAQMEAGLSGREQEGSR